MTRRPAFPNVAQQAFALRARFPGVHAKLGGGRLVWVGELQPTSLSRTYAVELTHTQNRVPRVRVLDELELHPGADSLPHVYSCGFLCLHKEGEWSPQMFLADTIVPWTAEWLAHYEIWLAVGNWYGGGDWPPARTPAKDIAAT